MRISHSAAGASASRRMEAVDRTLDGRLRCQSHVAQRVFYPLPQEQVVRILPSIAIPQSDVRKTRS